MDAHVKLKDWWAQTGANVATWPATAEAVDSIVRRYDLTLPEDFHRYLSTASPVDDNWDEEMGNWWPVGKIKNIPEEYGHAPPPFIPNQGQRFLFFLITASGAGRGPFPAKKGPRSARWC